MANAMFDKIRSEIKSTQWLFNSDSVHGELASFFDSYFYDQGRSLTISQLEEIKTDVGLAFQGRTHYLNISNLMVSVHLWQGAGNKLECQLVFTLPKDKSGLNRWKFSDSFPLLPLQEHRNLLPKLKKGMRKIDSSFSQYFDEFKLLNAQWVVSSCAQEKSQFGISLKEGMNFIAELKPESLISQMQAMSPQLLKPLILFGHVDSPSPENFDYGNLNQEIISSKQYPWDDYNYPVNGIHLQLALPTNFKLGGVKLSETAIRFYCPLDPNASLFAPISALTANLALNDSLNIELIGILDSANDQLDIEARLEGVSLGNLADLSGISGKNGFLSDIPTSLADALSPLKKLELTNFGFTLDFSSGITIDSLRLGIGAPDLSWKIYQNKVVIENLGAQFCIDQPFSKQRISDIQLYAASNICGADLDISAMKKGSEFIFSADLSGSQIPIKQLMKRLSGNIPAPADMNVNRLKLICVPGKMLQVIGALAEQPEAWELNLGPQTLSISDLKFDFMLAQNQPFSGQFRGTLGIGDNINIQTQYNVPGAFSLRGTAERIEFQSMLKKMCGGQVNIPKELDFTLLNSEIVIKKGTTALEMQIASTIAGLGAMAFEVKKVNGKWGAAAGISLAGRLSDLPGLKALKKVEKIILMQNFVLVVSTFDGPQFRFPEGAVFSSSGPVSDISSANDRLPKTAGKMIAGVNAYGQWEIGKSGKQGKLLQKIMNLEPSVSITLQAANPPSKYTSIFTRVDAQLNGQFPLVANVGVMVNNGTPSFFADGQAEFKINRKKYTAAVSLSFVASGAYFSGSLLGTVNIQGVQLSNLSLMASMNWGGVPSLGFAATIDVQDVSSSLALFFDSNDPSKSIFAGSLSDTTLKQVSSLFVKPKSLPNGISKILDDIEIKGTGEFSMPLSAIKSLDELDHAKVAACFKQHGEITLPGSSDQLLLVVKHKGRSWSITNLKDRMKHYSIRKERNKLVVSMDAQVYCVPQSTRIGLLNFAEGFLLNGSLSVLGLESTTSIEIAKGKGLSIASKLNKNLVIFDPAFFELAASKALDQQFIAGVKNTTKSELKGFGPMLSIATFRQPQNPIKQFRNPHIFFSGRLSLMGTVGDCYVSLSDQGAMFSLTQEVSSGLSFPGIKGTSLQVTKIEGNFSGLKQLGATAISTTDVDLKLDFDDLGKMSIKTRASGSVSVSFNGRKAQAKFDGSFVYRRKKYAISASLNVKSKDLENLSNIVAKEIEKAFINVFADAEEWAKFAKSGVMEGVETAEQAAKVLQKSFHKTEKDTAKVLKAAGNSMTDIGDSLKTVYKLNDKAMNSALKDAGFAASTVKKFVDSSYKKTAKEVSKAAKSTEKSVNKATKSAKKKGKKAKKRVKKAFK